MSVYCACVLPFNTYVAISVGRVTVGASTGPVAAAVCVRITCDEGLVELGVFVPLRNRQLSDVRASWSADLRHSCLHQGHQRC